LLSAVSRVGLPHALLHLLGQQRGHRKRGNALAPGPQAIEDQGQVNLIFAGVVLLVAFALWQGRAANPLLPPRVVLDRNRGGAYASMLIASAGMFGTFLFPTYYLQQTLGYSPVVTGFVFLPIAGGIAVAARRVSGLFTAPAREHR
jgi:hypothetical protein